MLHYPISTKKQLNKLSRNLFGLMNFAKIKQEKLSFIMILKFSRKISAKEKKLTDKEDSFLSQYKKDMENKMNKICNSLLFKYPKLLLILFILIFLPVRSFSKILTKKRAETFIQILLEEKGNLEEFVLPQELELSHRFNISYTYIKYKFLISYDIDPVVRDLVIKDRIQYKISI